MATQASNGSNERSDKTLTLEQCLEEINIKRKDWRFVDPKLWDNNVKAPNNDIDPIAATTYVARRIDDYTNGLAADEELFWDFRHDFQGWNEPMFKRANEIYARELKRILRFKGVFTGRLNMPPVEALTNLTEVDDYQRWPAEQLAEHSFDQRSVAYRRQQEYKNQGQHPEEAVQTTGFGTANRASRNQTHAPARSQEFSGQEEQERPSVDLLTNTIEHTLYPNPQRQSHQPPSMYNNFNRHRGFTPAYPQRPKGLSVPPKRFKKHFPHTPSNESAPNTRRRKPSMVPFSSAVNEPPPAYTAAPSKLPTNSRSTVATSSDSDPFAFLREFDVVFLIDDSASMSGRNWLQVSAALKKIAPICTAYDKDGIDLYFLNHTGLYNNVQNADRVQNIFQNVQPCGLTPTGQRLYDILKKYLGSYKEAPDDMKPKPIDSSPTDDVKSPIIGAAKELDHMDAPPWQIGIQFFQVGNDPGAKKALKLLDDGLADVARQSDLRDIVDTVPFKGEGGEELSADGILKVVLGSVNRRLDRSSEGLHQSP